MSDSGLFEQLELWIFRLFLLAWWNLISYRGLILSNCMYKYEINCHTTFTSRANCPGDIHGSPQSYQHILIKTCTNECSLVSCWIYVSNTATAAAKKIWAEKENNLQFRSAYVLREACQCLVVLWCWRKSQKSLVSPIYFNVTLSDFASLLVARISLGGEWCERCALRLDGWSERNIARSCHLTCFTAGSFRGHILTWFRIIFDLTTRLTHIRHEATANCQVNFSSSKSCCPQFHRSRVD